MIDTKIKNIWNSVKTYSIITLGTIAALYIIGAAKAYAQKIEDSDLAKSVITPGQTFEGEDLETIFWYNKDAFLDYLNPHGLPRAGEEDNVVILKDQFTGELSDIINIYKSLLKLNLNPGITDENPVDIDKVNELLGKEGCNAILFNRIENINPDAYIGLMPNETNIIDELNRKIDYIATFANTVDKNKKYNINILSHDNTPEAREQAVKGAARITIMDMVNAAHIDKVITNAIDDTTNLSSQLNDLPEGNYSLYFAPETGVWKLVRGNSVIKDINLDLDKILEDYNAQKEQYKETGEKPEIAQTELNFIEYVHPANLDGTLISLNEFSNQLKNIEKTISEYKQKWPDVVPEDIEIYTRRLEGEVKSLCNKDIITLSEIDYYDIINPQNRGYSIALSEIRNKLGNLPESDLKNGLTNVVEQYSNVLKDITKKGKTETGVAKAEKEQKKIEAERTPELNELIEKIQKLEKEKASVYFGPVVGYSDGSITYGATIVGKWKNWGIGGEFYHNGKSETIDKSKHNQEIGYGFTGDLTRIIDENNNENIGNAYVLRKINNRFWFLGGLGLNFSNESKSIYERTIVEKNGTVIDDNTQISGTSENKIYPVFVFGLNGHFDKETLVDWQLKGYYAKDNPAITGSILFDIGKLTNIGK